jgi:hypothetical protein
LLPTGAWAASGHCGSSDPNDEVTRIPDAIDVAPVSGSVTVRFLSRAKAPLSMLSVVCALTCLPCADMLWAASPEAAHHSPLHFGATRRALPGALWSNGSTGLREMLRTAERWRAGFVSLSSQKSKPANAGRPAARDLRQGRTLIVARCALARCRSGPTPTTRA